MYNILLSKDTKWFATLNFSTHYSYTNFNIDKDGKDDTFERLNSIKIGSYRSIISVCGLAVPREKLQLFPRSKSRPVEEMTF